MVNNEGRKITQDYWNKVWQGDIRVGLPSRLNVDILNFTQLIKNKVGPDDNYLEIGCAPGKLLAWVASVLDAKVTGLDYSQSGIERCRALFNDLGLKAELHHDDLFDNRLPPNYFDIVTSFGFIEHFSDSRLVVKRHMDLVKPGGVALITIPNYSGIYSTLQSWCDASSLVMHNLEIMNTDALNDLVDIAGTETVRVYSYGRFSPWLISLQKKLPWHVAMSILYIFNVLGLLQPFPISSLSPVLVLEIRKINRI